MCSFITWVRLCPCSLGDDCVVKNAPRYYHAGAYRHKLEGADGERYESFACERRKRKYGSAIAPTQECPNYWGVERKLEVAGFCMPCISGCTKSRNRPAWASSGLA